jgi:hypothetical protein
MDYGRNWWYCRTLQSASTYFVSGLIFEPGATRIRWRANHRVPMCDRKKTRKRNKDRNNDKLT